ncbi:putative glycosyltransferase [bacterium HR12]|nr:putative glycosyltransferase [bacterium HR12]
MKVSLVTTVLDARERIEGFLASLAAQTRAPDEVIVVDGGSTDGTLEVLRRAEGIRLIVEPGASIARGRNVAIAAATHDVIAVTDADCELEPAWLERLLVPIEEGADVAMGAYRPVAETFFHRCLAAVNLPDPAEWDEATFMPSSRSIAFRRSAIEAVGGYPEWLEIGEDMYVDHRFRELGLDMRLARDAVVRWHLRPDLRSTFVQYFRYARGDAIAGMHPARHALRFGVYGGALYAWASRGRLRKLATLVGAAAYARAPLARAARAFPEPAERAAAFLAVPALTAFLDVAKMAGYLAGLSARARRGAVGRVAPDGETQA